MTGVDKGTVAVGLALASGWPAGVACLAHVYAARGSSFDVGAYLECLLPVFLVTAVVWLSLLGMRLYRGRALAQGATSPSPKTLATGLGCTCLGIVVLVTNEGSLEANRWFCALCLELAVAGGCLVRHAWLTQDVQAPTAPQSLGASLVTLALMVVAGFGGARSSWVGLSLFALPVVSGCLLVVRRRMQAGRPADAGADVAPSGSGPARDHTEGADGLPVSIAVRFLLSCALLGCIFSLMTCNFMLTTFGRVEAWLAWGVPTGVLMAAMLVLFGRAVHAESTAHFSYRLLILPTALAFFPFNPGTEASLHFAFFFTFAAIAACVVVVPLLALDLGRRWAAEAFWPAGLGMAGVAVGGTLGCLAALVELRLGVLSGTYSIYLQAIACIALGFVATNLLFLDRRSFVAAYAQIAHTALSPSRGDVMSRHARVVAERYGLTPREREALEVLAHGHSLARVCEELCISEGTAISHRRNVYAKLGVHSRDELIDLVREAQE